MQTFLLLAALNLHPAGDCQKVALASLDAGIRAALSGDPRFDKAAVRCLNNADETRVLVYRRAGGEYYLCSFTR